MRSEGVDLLELANKKAIPEMLMKAFVEINAQCKCGAPLEVNAEMTYIRCSNPMCKYKRIAEAKRALEYIGAEEEEVANICERIEDSTDNFKCGCEVLIASDEYINTIVEKYLNRDFELTDILKITGIKLLGDSSKSIMRGYRSIKDMYADVDKNNVVAIARRLNMEKSAIVAIQIKEDLERCKETLLVLEDRLNVIVRRDSSTKRAGGISDNSDSIGVATDENADIVGVHTNNALYNKLADEVSKKKIRRGLSALENI